MPNVRKDWPAEEVEVLVAMRKDGATFREIGEVLGKTSDAVKGYVRERRDELGIDATQKQSGIHNRGRLGRGFDHEWTGGIEPFHWALTKPWGKQHAKGQ